MYGGKYLGRFLPFLNWGTHWFINKQALFLLEGEGIEVGEEFPSLGQINYFEEFQGPDGAWLRGEHLDSNMYWNPKTDEGNAPEEALRLFKKLIIAMEDKDSRIVAQEAAWLAHIVTDMLWPAHQVGKIQDVEGQYWFWKVKTDWYDGLTGSLWDKHDKHSKLEFLTTITFWGRRLGKSQIDHQFIAKAEKDQSLIIGYLKEKAEEIHDKELYQDFIKNGWSRGVKYTIDQEILPEMISAVATLWYLAHRLKKEQRVI
jgi:hypothetical protein